MGTWRGLAIFIERGMAIFTGRGVPIFESCTNPGKGTEGDEWEGGGWEEGREEREDRSECGREEGDVVSKPNL